MPLLTAAEPDLAGFPRLDRPEALARLAAVRPAAYARSRNALDGAVTGLSASLTHGVLSLPEVLAALCARQALPVQHKLVFELGWRAYFRHVWRHRGAGIFDSLHPGPRPEAACRDTVPADVREARSGLPVIDQAVRTLYASGHLHNHARLWLASYLVHLRGVHWRAGADWLLGLLFDGDLASNHLSWQWVAGTGSHQPYLFNAENVARHAPPAWHSPGTLLDTGYDSLLAWAQGEPPPAPAPRLAGVAEPVLLSAPPADLGLVAPQPAAVAGLPLRLVHPWHLDDAEAPPGGRVLALWPSDGPRPLAWRAERWRRVGQRLQALAGSCWWGPGEAIAQALATAGPLALRDDPHLPPALRRLATQPEPALFPEPGRLQPSFSAWWHRVTRGLHDAAELLPPERAPRPPAQAALPLWTPTA
ncbi:FAD-binding domain-containing protein [Ideonella dechloratans]|uniref:FAD-binding domain-containing protein n=1 Tax=Ideonella dechloratans TaxID=36863 RepID=UPI0035AFB9B2